MCTTETYLPDPTTIVVVPFYCEARHAPELQQAGYEVLRRLANASRGSSYVPPFKSTDGGKDAWGAPEWSDPADEPAARWLVNDLPENQRRVLASLIAGGPDGTSTGAVLAFGGYTADTSASPVFKAIGGRFRRVGRRPIWRGGEQTPEGQLLPVPVTATRDLFVNVIKSEYPDLATEARL